MQNFKGKIAIVTGGGQGLGKGLAVRLAKEGVSVVVADMDLDKAKATAEEISKGRGVAIAIKVDVGRSADVSGMVDAVIKKFGKIDILVNNAGITLPGFITDLSEEEWDKTIAVNLKGAFLCCKAASVYMIKQKYGKIINISSKSGKQGGLWLSAYCASKFGLIGFTQSLALDLAPFGINVNAICPGVIFTPMWDSLDKVYAKKLNIAPEKVRDYYRGKIPLGRDCSIEDVANVMIFLLSDAANYMTGQAINVTGGQEMR